MPNYDLIYLVDKIDGEPECFEDLCDAKQSVKEYYLKNFDNLYQYIEDVNDLREVIKYNLECLEKELPYIEDLVYVREVKLYT